MESENTFIWDEYGDEVKKSSVVYFDKITNRKYDVNINTESLEMLQAELTVIYNSDAINQEDNKLLKQKLKILDNCIFDLIDGNLEALDVLFYQNTFCDYDTIINELVLEHVKIVSDNSFNGLVIYGDETKTKCENIKKLIDVFKNKKECQEKFYKEILLKILGCIELEEINKKVLKK